MTPPPVLFVLLSSEWAARPTAILWRTQPSVNQIDGADFYRVKADQAELWLGSYLRRCEIYFQRRKSHTCEYSRSGDGFPQGIYIQHLCRQYSFRLWTSGITKLTGVEQHRQPQAQSKFRGVLFIALNRTWYLPIQLFVLRARSGLKHLQATCPTYRLAGTPPKGVIPWSKL